MCSCLNKRVGFRMSPTISIKNFSAEDIPFLQTLVQDGHHQTEDSYFERSLVEQTDGKRLLFVAMEENGPRAVGYVHYNRFPHYAPFRRFGVPEIQDLYVHPDWRRQGIGFRLIQACEEQARRDGLNEIGIGVGVMSDFGDAQRLYIRHGFKPDGAGAVYEREPVRSGEIRALDDRLCLMMTKTLDSPSLSSCNNDKGTSP